MIRRQFMKTALAAGLTSAAVPAAAGAARPASGASGHGGRKKPRIMFYNDARHPAIYMYEPPMEKEQFEAAVDEVLGYSGRHPGVRVGRTGARFSTRPRSASSGEIRSRSGLT